MEKSFSDKVAEARAAVSAISAREAKERMTTDPDCVFIDPRNTADISATTGIIPGALNLPLADLGESAGNGLPPVLASRDRTIIAACQGGPMGALAAHALKRRGFRNVYYIDGGTQEWLDAGFDTKR